MLATHRPRPWRSPLLVLSALLALSAALPAPAARAEVRSLFGRSAAFAAPGFDLVFTPDGSSVLFAADLEQDSKDNLYRAPLAGGQPTRLSDVPAGRGVRSFMLSPDGEHVVYLSEQELENRTELYSVPLAGGQPVKLNNSLPTGGNVETFEIDPVSRFVVYTADEQTNDVMELHRAPIAGGQAITLNAPLVAGGDVLSDFAISANGQFVVYRATQAQGRRAELYSVPSGGGTVETLNGPLPASGGLVDYFRLSPVLNIAVYVSNETGAFELHSVQLNGNLIGKLNAPLPAGKRVTYINFTPDGQRVTYTAGTGFGGDAEAVLFSVSTFGGTAVQLSPNPGAGSSLGFERISPDSSVAVYSFVPASGERATLYSAQLATGARTPIHTVGEGQSLSSLSISKDSAWVVLSESGPGSSPVYALPIGGGTLVQLSFSTEYAFSPLISPASDRVLFTIYTPNVPTCEDVNSVSAQIFGGGRRQLTALCGKHVDSFKAYWYPDGSHIVYVVTFNDQQRNDAGFELLVSDGQAVPQEPAPGQVEQRVMMPMVGR